MENEDLSNLFDVRERVIVITGGGGVICSAIGRGLARLGARVVLLDISAEAVRKVCDQISLEDGRSMPVQCNVLDKTSVQAAVDTVQQAYGPVDILINGAGGNKPQATTGPQQPFFDIPADAIQWVFDLNFMGSLLPTQVFGKTMAGRGEGVILNIASMNAFRPLTNIPAYSAAKAALANFTQWLAVHMAQEYSPNIRVNAIAPGFLLTQQNRFLLMDVDSGELTPRGRKILDHTPLGRFVAPEELLSTVLWLVSPGACAVTGVVVPVDGGFSAYSGV